jgi:hypothetical protein
MLQLQRFQLIHAFYLNSSYFQVQMCLLLCVLMEVLRFLTQESVKFSKQLKFETFRKLHQLGIIPIIILFRVLTLTTPLLKPVSKLTNYIFLISDEFTKLSISPANSVCFLDQTEEKSFYFFMIEVFH